MNKRVGFVATGNEIVTGDIINSNGQYFATILNDHKIQPGRQVVVSDDEAEITEAINYLMKDHDCIITIGGLGPTSDDLTRYALSKAINTPLEFYEEVWHWIETLFQKYNLPIPDNNKQQAMLPAGSTALHNHNGSAAACHIEHHGKDFFMLPGPPNECFTIFHEHVLPLLIKKNYPTQTYRKSWLLLNVSEGSIAEKFEALIKPYKNLCEVGYRVSYPYLEVKASSPDETALNIIAEQFEALISEHLVSHQKETASQQLIKWIVGNKRPLLIEDNATHGLLASTLLSPETYPYLHFTREKCDKPFAYIKCSGMTLYWQSQKDAELQVQIESQNKLNEFTKRIPYRKGNSLLNALESICWFIIRTITQ